MRVKKYNGLGNDFVIILHQNSYDYENLASKLCKDSRFLADGLIAINQHPLEMIFYNRDGSRAPMCGNGIRCLAHYLYDENINNERSYPVKTLVGEMEVTVSETSPFRCEIMMGEPIFRNEVIGIDDPNFEFKRQINFEEQRLSIYTLFMGTIHTVVFVEDAVAELDKKTGEFLCHHPMFLEQTNVNFVQVINQKELKVRTYERGVGWTLACGTGCCASYVVARDLGLAIGETRVHLEQGFLTIRGDKEIYMEGPSEFELEVEFDEL